MYEMNQPKTHTHTHTHTEPVIQALITSHRNIRWQTVLKQPDGREKRRQRNGYREINKGERKRKIGLKRDDKRL